MFSSAHIKLLGITFHVLTHHVNDYCSVHHITVEFMIGFLLHVASDQNDHLEIGASDRYRGKLIMMINDNSI